MWKGPTVPMDSLYPFGVLSDKKSKQKHLVRKIITCSERQLEKARVQANLKHDCLIKLEYIQQEDNICCLLFEYVPQSVDKWHTSVSREFIENYEQRLILFSRYLADRGIITIFAKENMGVSEGGEAKYFLDPGFEMQSGLDKISLKKKYKEQIRELIQSYIDTKVPKGQTKQVVPEKKENSKLSKILEAIEKGKANLVGPKDKAVALQQQGVSENKSTFKSIKNIQNIYIQKEVNKVNKIQVIVNNQPVEVLQRQLKKEYASSSFYVNGMPTVVMQRGGQTRRLFSPNDKFARFEEVKYKEYKSLKTSGEGYVQDFINVLEAEGAEGPGSPRLSCLRGVPRIGAPKKDQLAIQPEKKKDEGNFKRRTNDSTEESNKITSARGETPQPNKMFQSQHRIKVPPQQQEVDMKSTKDTKLVGGKTNALQKKVSEAIANSLNAISKFKSSKNQMG